MISGWAVVVAALVLVVPARAADSRVEIVMQDPSTNSDIHAMQMVAKPATVPAGKVTLHATNESKQTVHEVVVVKVRSFDDKLPYNPEKSEVIERRVKRLGEIADLKPGSSGALTLRLAPGNYVLLCNQPGHYQQNMWTKLIVSR